MLATLAHYEGLGYKLHAYVIMPDHLHLLMTPAESVEKSVQLIKGGFSFRARRELNGLARFGSRASTIIVSGMKRIGRSIWHISTTTR